MKTLKAIILTVFVLVMVIGAVVGYAASRAETILVSGNTMYITYDQEITEDQLVDMVNYRLNGSNTESVQLVVYR